MRRLTLKWVWLLLLLLLCLSAAPGCGDDDDDDAGASDDDDSDDDDSSADDDDTVDDDTPDDDTGDDDTSEELLADLLANGKQYLAAGEYLAAFDTFYRAGRIDETSDEARFGLVLASLQNTVGLIDIVFGLLSPYVHDGTEPDASPALKSVVAEDDDWVAVLADSAFQNLILLIDAQLERLAALQAATDFSYLSDGLPIKFKEHEFFNLGPEWDTTDLYVIAAFYHVLDALLQLLSSQSLEGIADLVEVIDNGDDILAGILTAAIAHPELLTLKDDGGEAWNASAQALSDAADALLTAATMAAAETDDQSDDVFVQNESLDVGHVTHFALQGQFITGAQQVKLLWDGTSLSVKDSLTRLRDHLGGDADARLRFEDDLVMAVGVLADFLWQGVGIQGVLALLPLEVKEDLTRFGNGELLPSLLIAVLPLLDVPTDAFQFDLAAFYSRPFPLRELLPYFGVDPYGDQPVFYGSYECARLGYAASDFAPGDDLAITLADRGPVAAATPGAGNDSVEVTVQAIAPDKAVVDTEHLTLDESATFAALFAAALPTESGATGVDDNGVLTVPAGASVTTVYLDENGAETFTIDATYDAAGETDRVFAYDMGCRSGTARDYEHFDQAEFADAYYFAEPPATLDPLTPYGVAAIDGVALAGPYYAFSSPSLNGLLWLNMSNLHDDPGAYGFATDWAPADVRGVNLLLYPLIDLIGGLF
ncbi:MAG TPA: hypothetical protein PKW95_18540 [bacterium]|nr:hypothetical protein [bacterium]